MLQNDTSLNDDYPMPFEAHLTDEELVEYRIQQQQQQLLPSKIQLRVGNINPDSDLTNLNALHCGQIGTALKNLAGQQKLQELENQKKQSSNRS